MSAILPVRRLLPRCQLAPSTSLQTPSIPILRPRVRGRTLPIRYNLASIQQRRAASDDSKPSDDLKSKSNDDANRSSNAVLDEYMQKYPETGQPTPQGPTPEQLEAQSKKGDLSSSSIFQDLEETPAPAVAAEPTEEEAEKARKEESMKRVLDVEPASRERWQRKKVIQLVRKGGRLNKAEMIKRTEREHAVRSHNMKTSVKKLGMLARQIAGKPIDDAITQMRFSKKKVAREVLTQLEAARDEAIVARGMGLGAVVDNSEAEPANPLLADPNTDATALSKPQQDGPIEIQLKDGRRHRVKDRSTIYIDQAWVGRGPFGKLMDYRARGVGYVMRTPWTSISVVLKEEHTRIREWKEREAKRKRKTLQNVWTHLPDRPVQWQRPWYTF